MTNTVFREFFVHRTKGVVSCANCKFVILGSIIKTDLTICFALTALKTYFLISVLWAPTQTFSAKGRTVQSGRGTVGKR